MESIIKNYIASTHADEKEKGLLESFFSMPYVITPKSKNEVWVAVPRFLPLSIGFLHSQTPSYNLFIVNRYIDWITPLPEEIRKRIGASTLFRKAEVYHETLTLSNKAERDKALSRYADDIEGIKDEHTLCIRKGHEFSIISHLIQDGTLPFVPQGVKDEDLRPAPTGIRLRPYQLHGWDMFKETGMVGIYWPPSAGKTYISLYCGERVRGKKLVVVPSRTLKEQWMQKIATLVQHPEEWEVQTYHYLIGKKGWVYSMATTALTIFDEAHHLPATTFSKLSTIRTKYRIGLSASPYREDGRTDYIFALTGFPVGMDWGELMRIGIIEQPSIRVMLCTSRQEKRNKLEYLLKSLEGKILVFCDSLREGDYLSKYLLIPYVHGKSVNRMETFAANRIVIASRIADEGLSIKDLGTVIEYDFLGGSRRQETQRVGRVMHGEHKGKHIILMTDSEFNKYEKRLYALEEHGMRISFQR